MLSNHVASLKIWYYGNAEILTSWHLKGERLQYRNSDNKGKRSLRMQRYLKKWNRKRLDYKDQSEDAVEYPYDMS